MSPLHVASTAVLFVLFAGFVSRSNQRRHRVLMLLAFAVDLGLVLYIEATRGAIEKVAGGVPALLGFHVLVSTAVLVCYVGMIGLGGKLFTGRVDLRLWHRHLGITFVVLRSLNYITSFMI